MKNKRIIGVVLGFISLCNISMVNAEIPDNLVLIGEKAFDLNYVNDNKNVKEIVDEVKKNSDKIFIKVNDNWFSNETSKRINKIPIGYFQYKNDFYVIEDELKIEELDIKENLYILADRVKLINVEVKNKIIIDEKVEQVTLNGNYNRISVQPNNTEIIIESGTVEEINIEGDCTINLGEKGNIQRLITNGYDVKIQGEGKKNIKKIYGEKNINTEDKNVYNDKNLIEVKVYQEKKREDIVNLYIKCRSIEDLYGLQMDVNYDPSILIIEDVLVDDSLSDKLNIRFKDYKGNASCIASLSGNVKGLNVNGDLIKVKIRLLNKDKKTLNLLDNGGDLEFNFKLSNSKAKEIKIDNIEIGE